MTILKKLLWPIKLLLLIGPLCTNAQTSVIINGRVIDNKNNPIQKVTVGVKGEAAFTTTDDQGEFNIAVKNPSVAVLTFSSIGFNTMDVQVSGKTNLEITMLTNVTSLTDVVVVGYGTQKKVNLTGSVASIGGDQLTNRPITNISTALQGELPGVSVIQRSGQPGKDNGTIRIRGIGTMNNADPMVVVDGIEASMEDINPNDIESISVLKDASAGAIYGSRAANGVILVTTKRGKSGVPKIKYNGYLGQQKPTTLPKWLDSYEYAKLLNEGLKNEGLTPRYTEAEIEKFRTGSDPENYPNTDWTDLFFRGSGIQQSHNLSISGGSDASKYFLSVGYLDQKGLVKKTNSERYNIRFNLDSRISDNLSFGLTSSLSKQYIEEPTGAPNAAISDLLIETNRIPPTFLNKNADGSWARHIEGNPIAKLEDGGLLYDDNYHALINVFAEMKIVEGLKLRGSFGIDFNMMDRSRHIKDITYGDGTFQGPNSVSDRVGRNMRTIPQALLTYQKEFKSHAFTGLLGASRESFRHDENLASRRDFPSNELTELDAGALEGSSNNGFSYETRLESYFGRLNYNFDSKYLFEATLRYDGSSKFESDKRWGMFPSFAAGWRISEEPFMKSVAFVNNLKLRVSYGSLGNNATGDYQFINRISLGQIYPFGESVVSGAAQTSASSQNLKWERSSTLNAGVDIGLLNGKLTFTGDYYDRYTDNILIAVPVSLIYGLPAPTINGGAMRNKGVEFQLGLANIIGQVSYNASFNIGLNKGIVEKYPNPSKGIRIFEEGYEWNSFYGYEYIGFYQTDKQITDAPIVKGAPVQKGDLMFKDQNGDNIIDAADRVALGSDFPGITYGLNLGAKYKNIDVSLFGQGADQVKQLLANNILFPFLNGYKAQKSDLDRWTPETPNASNPVIHISQTHNYSTISSFMVRNASYFRLKNIQMGYTLRNLSLRFVQIEQVRIYLTGQNLVTFTKLNMERGFDPESPTNANNIYPNVKNYTIGINVNF